MAVTVAAVGSVTSGNAQTIATSLPSGVVSGSLLVLFCSVRHSGGESPATPSGWTLAGSAEPSTSRVYCWHRYADTTAADTPTIDLGADASQGMQAVILRIVGATASDPVDSTNTGSGTTQSVLPIPTSSVTDNDSLALACMCVATGGAAYTHTWPSPWTERIDNWVDGVVRHAMTLGSLGVASGTSTGGDVTPSTAATYAALTVIFKPAAGSGFAIPVAVHHMRQQGMA